MTYDSINDAVTMRPGAGEGSALGRIDQYELLRELGGGGFGTVYLALDTVSGVEVAVKGLPPFVKNNREELENIRANFALVSRLSHTNIAKALVLHPAKDVSYASEDVRQKLRVLSGDFLMVMEYAPGVTLSQWRKQFPGNKVPLAQALGIVRQVASAIDYAHGRRIVHRDIKPANVMIETAADGRTVARILDFGLAAEIRSSMGRTSREIHDTSGTRPYMAPEQWLGGKQGPATDQYALAVLFHELIAGDVPFSAVFDTGDPVVMMNVVGRELFAPPDGLPKPVRLSLAKALAKKPEDRFASCTEFVDALEGKVKVSRGGVGARGEGSAGKVLVVFSLLAALGAGGWWYYVRQHKAAPPTPTQPKIAVEEPPRPEPQPEPTPSEPQPVQQPEPQPEPKLAPQPVLQPAPQPIEPEPKPASQSDPQPAPQPEPKPAPQPDPQPAPQPIEPESKPAPQPVQQPAPVPAEKPAPAAPAAKPAAQQPVVVTNEEEKVVFTVADLEALDTSDLKPGEGRDVRLSCGAVVSLNWCPPGEFRMESPAKTVKFDSGFWMGRYEVSQGLWDSIMQQGSSHAGDSGKDAFPLGGVSRNDCLRMVAELNRQNETSGFRLPSDAEWEYACRAGATTPFHYGTLGSTSRMSARSKVPQRVGAFEPNAWGLFDMHGNMAEWCMDPYPSELVKLFQRDGYTLRGGSYKDREQNCSASARRREASHKKHPTFGMRLCFSDGGADGPVPSTNEISRLGIEQTEKDLLAKVQHEGFVLNEKDNPRPAGEERRVQLGNGESMSVVWCPPGWFMMGSSREEPGRDGSDGAETLHAVQITKGFWIGKYEVTRSQWKAVMGSGDDGQKPKTEVSYEDCRDFARKCRARLPTEAEWEYACRAGTRTPYSTGSRSGGHAIDKSKANVDAFWGMDDVGNYAEYANAWGINDMHGNAGEWCADIYSPYPDGKSLTVDPRVADDSAGGGFASHVVRGGHCFQKASLCRCAARTTGKKDKYTGFRVCYDDLP